MPFVQLLPATFPSWIRDTGWPINTTLFNRGAAIGGNDPAGYTQNEHTPAQDFFMKVKAGLTQPNYQIHRQVAVAQLSPGGTFMAGYLWGDNLIIHCPLTEFPCGVSVGQMYRVWIDEFYVAFETPAVLTTETKPVAYVLTNGATDPNLALDGNEQYGLRSDGAGGFEYYSTINSVLTETAAVTWPVADLSEFVRVRCEHFAAQSAALPAVFRMTLNNTVAITRSFAAAGNLPNYGSPGVANKSEIRRAAIADVSSTDMFCGQYRCRAGDFDGNGVPVN